MKKRKEKNMSGLTVMMKPVRNINFHGMIFQFQKKKIYLRWENNNGVGLNSNNDERIVRYFLYYFLEEEIKEIAMNKEEEE